jgi:hypothetical protein
MDFEMPEMDSTQILALVGIVVVAISVVGYVAYAAYTATLPGDLTVTGEGLAFYNDAQGTVLVSTLHVGNVHNGTSVTKTIYLKNTGNIAKGDGLSSSGLPTGVSVSWNKEGVLLSPNFVTATDITFSASNGAPQSVANKTFGLVFTPQ